MNIREARAKIEGNSEYNTLSGTINFKQVGDQVRVIIDLENLPKSKFLGFHIHAKGDCSGNDEDEFKNVGKHYNPSRAQHPDHAGDLTSIYSSNGRIHQEFETNKFTVDEIIGKSVIIHSDRDDFKSQPSGDSGDKIACGTIEALIGDNVKLVKEDLRVWDQESIDNQNALAGIAREIEKLFDESDDVNYGTIDYDIFDYGNEILIKDVYDPDDIGNFIEDELGFRFRVENTQHGYGDVYVDTTQEYEDENGDIHTRVSREYLKEENNQTKKCALCGKEFKGYGNNGQPLVDGTVCDECNVEVIKARLSAKDENLDEDVELSHEPEDISHIIFDSHYGNKFVDEVAVADRGDIDYYYTLITNVNDAEKFNYHSDYWGYDKDYQEQNVELMDKLSPYIGKEVQIDYDDGSITGKLLGIAVDKQYNDISHTKVILDSIKDNLDESANPLKDMADEAKKKQKGLGAFVKLDAGNVEQNVATFNANMTPNIGEDLELSDEEIIEPRTINIKHELRNHDMDNNESFGNLSDTYEFLENELSIDDKKNIISFMLKGDYDSISKLLNSKIDDKLDSELGDFDRYVDKNYR